jgi:hypothetical protein
MDEVALTSDATCFVCVDMYQPEEATYNLFVYRVMTWHQFVSATWHGGGANLSGL